MTNFLSNLNLDFLGSSSGNSTPQSSLLNPSESIYNGFLNFSSSSSVASSLVGYDLDSNWLDVGADLNGLLNNPPPMVSESLKSSQSLTDILNNQPDVVKDALNYDYNKDFLY